jgi:hypothetical protein
VLVAPYIVLDQNAFRRPHLLAPALAEARRHSLRLLVIDAAMVEMVKHPDQWELALRLTLRQLAAEPGLVVVGQGTPELLRMERNTGKPSYGQIGIAGLTDGFRALLAELHRGSDGPGVAYLRQRIATAQADIISQYLDHDQNKARVRKWVDTLASIFDPEERKRLQEPAYRRRVFAGPVLTDLMRHHFGKFHPSSEAVERLAQDRSVTAHWLLSEILLAVRWLTLGGLNDQTKPERLTNDLLDMEYATIASFCAGIVSEEPQVNEVTEDIKAIAEMRAAG